MKNNKPIIFGPPKPSKNQRYVAAQKAKGLKSITGWVPHYAYDDAMAQFGMLCDWHKNGEHFAPFMARDMGKTGKMRKSV